MQIRDPVKIMNVEKPSAKAITLFNTEDLKQRRKHFRMLKVENRFVIVWLLLSTTKSPWWRNPMSASSVARSLTAGTHSLNIREPTQERNRTTVRNVGEPSHTAQPSRGT